MNRSLVAVASPSKSRERRSWDRMPGESNKGFSAFCTFRDLGIERTYQCVADQLQKSGALIRRWAARWNWKNRALDFDEYVDKEMERAMLSRRNRLRRRALDIADELDQKVAEAVGLLKVGRVVKVEGQADQAELTITPTDIVRLLQISQQIQKDILGDPLEDRVAEVHLHFTPYDTSLPVPVNGVEPPLIDGDDEDGNDSGTGGN